MTQFSTKWPLNMNLSEGPLCCSASTTNRVWTGSAAARCSTATPTLADVGPDPLQEMPHVFRPTPGSVQDSTTCHPCSSLSAITAARSSSSIIRRRSEFDAVGSFYCYIRLSEATTGLHVPFPGTKFGVCNLCIYIKVGRHLLNNLLTYSLTYLPSFLHTYLLTYLLT